jgi:hypothetical protein
MLGVDLSQMQEDRMKDKDKSEEIRKKREEEEKIR